MSEQNKETQEVQQNLEQMEINDKKYDEEQKNNEQDNIDIQNEGDEDECYNTVEEFFLDSVRLGDLEDVQECINDKVDITWFDQNLKNALHMVAGNGHMEILELIFKAIEEQKWDEEQLNKFINLQNADGQTPLHFAVFCDQKQVAEYLLEKKANVEIKNQIDNTAFDEAMSLEKFDLAELIAKYTKADLEDEQYKSDENYQVPASKDDVVEEQKKEEQQ